MITVSDKLTFNNDSTINYNKIIVETNKIRFEDSNGNQKYIEFKKNGDIFYGDKNLQQIYYKCKGNVKCTTCNGSCFTCAGSNCNLCNACAGQCNSCTACNSCWGCRNCNDRCNHCTVCVGCRACNSACTSCDGCTDGTADIGHTECSGSVCSSDCASCTGCTDCNGGCRGCNDCYSCNKCTGCRGSGCHNCASNCYFYDGDISSCNNMAYGMKLRSLCPSGYSR